MAEQLTLVSAPKLRSSIEKLANLLLDFKQEALFLDFSREIEEYVRMLAEGLPYNYVMAEIRRNRLIPEATANSWEYYAEPLLKKLKNLKERNPNLKLHCYGSSAYEHLSSHLAVKIALLTLRSMTTGKVDVQAWRRLLEEDLKAGGEALEDAADLLVGWAEKYGGGTCISSVPRDPLGEKLKERGVKLRVLEVEPNYVPTPMETLKREVARGAEDDRIRELVQAHINYVRRFVLPSRNLDEAYWRWVESRRREFKG